jgi:hypothetical protein
MYAFDIESYYDKELNVRELGAFNYLARAEVYLVSFWGPDGGWVGHPSDVDWCWFKGSELWSHNRAFDGAFLAARGLPDPGGNCTSNLAAFLCGHHSLKDAAKVMVDVDVSKEMREEMEGVKWTDLSPGRQQNLREYALGDQRLLQGPGDFDETLSGMISSAALFQHTLRYRKSSSAAITSLIENHLPVQGTATDH